MKDIRKKLLATFQVEHKEHLKYIRDILAASTQAGGPPAATDLDEIFRRAHSLKGAARAVDLRPIENLAHRLETLFSRVRSGSVPLDQQVTAVVHKVLNASEDLLASLSENKTPAAPADALESIEKLLGMETTPAPPVEPEAVAEPAPPPAFQPIETVRLMASNLDRLVNSTGQLSTENLRQDLLSQKLRYIDKQVHDALAEHARARRLSNHAFRVLDRSQELAGVARYIEYLEHQARLISNEVRTTRRLHEKNAWALRSLAGELQTEVRQARMVPAENVFESFPKMVRDLARDQQKTVELQIVGSEVQADRMVLQALKDPLMHVLRNAVSHGIETEAERKAKGKPPGARIQIRIETGGNRFNVTVDDDGRGLNLARISEVAVQQGLISSADAASRSPEELARLVFLAGFSTSRSVNEVSGRGMGLSVVAEAVARLQGKVDIQPADARGARGGRAGAGTRVSISVPLSISSQRLLLVSCQEQTFAIPLHGIETLRRIAVKDVETVEGKPVVKLGRRHVSLVTLAHVLGTGHDEVSADRQMLCVAILKVGETRLAVAVDAFLSGREAVIKELPPVAAKAGKLAGGILLEDGSVCLVLNPAEIVTGFRQSGSALLIKTAERKAVQKSSRILVVDDSLTTRTLEKNILESHGYEVAVAIDGLEALHYLRSESVGLVVSDVEMPRMDGFTLLKEMKSDTRLASIPVIIVSSLENREYQQRGLELGADAYIVKRKFEQRELLETIQQIL